MRRITKLITSLSNLPKDDLHSDTLYDNITSFKFKKTSNSNAHMWSGETPWGLYITGSYCEVKAASDWGFIADQIEVSVDGQDFYFAPINKTNDGFVLFNRIADKEHFVIIRMNPMFADAAYIKAQSDSFRIKGRNPSVAYPKALQMSNPSATTHYSAGFTKKGSQVNGGVFSAQYTVSNGSSMTKGQYDTVDGNSWPVIGVGTPSITFITSEPSIVVYGGFTRCLYTIDNDPTLHEVSRIQPQSNRSSVAFVDNLSGEHRYTFWMTLDNKGFDCSSIILYVRSVITMSEPRRMYQFGDSITEGAGYLVYDGATPELMRVAASLGFIGSTSGTGGEDIAQLEDRLDRALAYMIKPPTANDVVIIAIGRNDVSAWNINGYLSIISKLKTAGFGTVICRGILPNGMITNVPWTTQNQDIADLVLSLNDPSVVYLNTDSWEIATQDLVHPSTEGYNSLYAYCVSAYSSILQL